MHSTDKRVAMVRARTRALARQAERRVLTGLSALSICLLTALTWTVAQYTGVEHGVSPGELTGSSLLVSSAGGYVLVAVLSFAAAVVVTTLCFRFRRKQTETQTEAEKDKSKENAE